MDGVLNINKPAHMTSHDVVLKVRSITKEKRIGHTGTLDPLATGVLVLCVGRATRIARYLEAGEKEYRAVMQLGVMTDTLDAEGNITAVASYSKPDISKIAEALQRFKGTTLQRPPAYSAVKVSGVPSYKLARRGKDVPLAARPIYISKIELISYDDPYVLFTVRCSKGTYVRTLCDDVGKVLGMGAHLKSLVRTRAGQFTLDESVTLDEFCSLAATGRAEEMVISSDQALSAFPALLLLADESARVAHGNQIPCACSHVGSNGDRVRLHDSSGGLLAVARIDAGVLKPEIVFS